MYGYPPTPYPPYWCPPGQQQLPTLDELKAHRKMIDEWEKEVLDKDKEKKHKKGKEYSKMEAVLLMLWAAPIIVAGEFLGGLIVWRVLLAPALGLR